MDWDTGTMKNTSAQFKNIITEPGFRMVWASLVVFVAAFAISAYFLPTPLVLIEAGLFCILFVFLFASVYGAVRTSKETAIERNELQSILNGLDDAIIVYDDRFNVIFFNPAAERLFKIKADVVLGHTLVPQDVERAGWQTLVQVIFSSLAPRVVVRSKEGASPEVVDLSFSDPAIELRVTTAPIMEEKGKKLAFMKIIRDRTGEIAALRSNTEFVTIASHQLRGPLTNINWALQSLEQSAHMADTDKLIVTTAAAAGRNLLRRVDDLLTVAKIDEGHFGYNFEEANIVDFLGTILNDVLPQARTAGVKIFFDRPTVDLPRVMIDPKQLSVAVVNIMENAIRYNVENGEVIVKVVKDDKKPFIAVTVRDTGIGIPKESVKQIFMKFFRADNAGKLQTEGSGLGLYIAKGIVVAHGGDISAESELNRGTIITFTIPTDPALVPKRETGAEYL
jgi:two-component system sensor histidine kinase VicK